MAKAAFYLFWTVFALSVLFCFVGWRDSQCQKYNMKYSLLADSCVNKIGG